MCGPEGAQVVVDRACVAVLRKMLKKIETCPVQVQEITLGELKPRQSVEKTVTIVESSLRLDAVASGALGLSRSKLTKLITKGEVMVDWKKITNPAAAVQSRQTIVTSAGRQIIIDEVSTTNKGNYRIVFRKS